MSKKPPFKKTIRTLAIPNQSVLMAQGQIKAEEEAGIVREVSAYGKDGALNLDLDPNERELCMRIAMRGAEFMRNYGVEEDVLTAAIDIAAVHKNFQPLQLLSFAITSDATDFAHDYSRIRRLINRTTGLLPSDTVLKFAQKADKIH